MEPKASEFALEDVISSMPDIVITHILNRLPIQDAVKTGILSKNWRFKWTMLSELVFDELFFIYLLETNGESKFERIISRLLLHVKGAITKFVLNIDERWYSMLDDEDIAHWILFLSRNGIKDLTIGKTNGEPLKLPTHIFSCLELGLPHFESSKFGEFITQCPLLEILNMRYRRFILDILNTRYHRHLLEIGDMDILAVGKMELFGIGKIANLKMLSLSLCDTVMITNSSSIFKLVGFLPKLQELNLDFVRCKFTEGGAKKRFLTTFHCLRTLTLSTIDLSNGIMLSCALELIRSFPNLQTLEITASDLDGDPTPAVCSPDVDYNTMELVKLQSVVFNYSKASENEACLIKYLLASSPFLKRVVVRPHSLLFPHEKLFFARKLLKLHRASSIAEIDLY